MGDDKPAPTPPPQPAAPNYAAANREAVQADIDTLPLRNKINAAAQLGQRYVDPDTGKVYDFTGVGGSDLAKAQAESQGVTGQITAQNALDLQRKYGVDFANAANEELKAADPTGYALRQKLAAQTTSDLEAGGNLTSDEEATLNQQVRGAQAARGNILGAAPTSQEVLAKTGFAQQKKQQAQANAQAYVLGNPLTSQYQNLAGAQNGTAPNNPINASAGQTNPNAGFSGTQFASNIFGTQMSGYNAGLGYSANMYNTQTNAPNPWLQLGGAALGAGASLGGAALL